MKEHLSAFYGLARKLFQMMPRSFRTVEQPSEPAEFRQAVRPSLRLTPCPFLSPGI